MANLKWKSKEEQELENEISNLENQRFEIRDKRDELLKAHESARIEGEEDDMDMLKTQYKNLGEELSDINSQLSDKREELDNL